jgi:hypothetical protein
MAINYCIEPDSLFAIFANNLKLTSVVAVFRNFLCNLIVNYDH